MKAVIYEAFNALSQLKNFPYPTPGAHGVVGNSLFVDGGSGD